MKKVICLLICVFYLGQATPVQREQQLREGFSELYEYGVVQFAPVAKYFLRYLSATGRAILADGDLYAGQNRQDLQAIVNETNTFVRNIDAALEAPTQQSQELYEKAKLVFTTDFPWLKPNVASEIRQHFHAIRTKHANITKFVDSLNEPCRGSYENFLKKFDDYVGGLSAEEQQTRGDLMEWHGKLKDSTMAIFQAKYFWRFLNWAETVLNKDANEGGQS